MSLIITAQPAEEPMSLEQARLHLRIDEDMTDDDQWIERKIIAAREMVEEYTNRAIVTQSYQLKLDRFSTKIIIPNPPLQSVESINYIDTSGNVKTLDSSGYVVDVNSQPGKITLAYNESWPSTLYISDAVTVNYIAGYGLPSDSDTVIPERIMTAMELLISHFFENREMSVMPDGIKNLLKSLRIIPI